MLSSKESQKQVVRVWSTFQAAPSDLRTFADSSSNAHQRALRAEGKGNQLSLRRPSSLEYTQWPEHRSRKSEAFVTIILAQTLIPPAPRDKLLNLPALLSRSF